MWRSGKILTYLLNGLVEWAGDLRLPGLPISRTQLTAALEPLLLPVTAALEEVACPLGVTIGPVFARSSRVTSRTWENRSILDLQIKITEKLTTEPPGPGFYDLVDIVILRHVRPGKLVWETASLLGEAVGGVLGHGELVFDLKI